MKRYVLSSSLGVAVAVGLALTPMVTPVAAAVSPQYKMEKKTIVLNGKTISHPYGFTYNNTTYMPIWYVEQGLTQLGITSSWKNNVWNLQVPSTMAVDKSNIQVGSGKISLDINGQLMHKVNGIAAVDPASGKATTFIPIWYTQQLLSRVGITAPWDGTTWTLSAPTKVTPPPALPANEVPVWQVLQQVESAFGISAKATGTSSYSDIATTDSHFAVVQTAIRNHLYTPPSSTHSGAYDAMSVGGIDQVLWNAYGLTDASFEPGGAPFAWANDTGLNPSGVQTSDLLSPQELSEIVSNIAHHQTGFVKLDADTYQVEYPIRDEATATFNGDSAGGQPFFTSNQDVQNAIIQTYQFFDSIQVTNENGTWVLTMPSEGATSWFSYTTTLGQIQYERPGDTTWSTTDVLDSRDLGLAADDSIRVKLPTSASISISMNQMLPNLGGTVVLGEIQVAVENGALSVQRIDISS
ncbi:hypothetical protein AAC03nite_03900 [Alicyclobacillus acidoterrestris]|nr:hypothetical protein AAC03nite_03900 [Alicyclobacillus acidoterrestris]